MVGLGSVWKSGVVRSRRSLCLLAGLRTQVLSAQGWPEERSVCLKACLHFPVTSSDLIKDVISPCKPCYLSTLNPGPGRVEVRGLSNFQCGEAEMSVPQDQNWVLFCITLRK